ncbi:MAG: hypothetical protein IJ890_05645 [Clostridia bacterium]|nr:hypothetical protein [Clostridia bacterium]
MSRAERVRNTIVRHCNNCCIGICEVCILNTLKNILDERFIENGEHTRKKRASNKFRKRTTVKKA